MTVAERNFNDFRLGDNVYKLADDLIPEVAGKLDVELGRQPSSEALGNLVYAIGDNKVLRANREVEGIGRENAIYFVDYSGIQEALDRSLWTPAISTGDKVPEHVVITGGVANWQDRAANLLADGPGRNVHIAVGNRVMDSDTERDNPNVQTELDQLDRFPTEAEYARDVIAPKLAKNGHDVKVRSYKTPNGEEIAKRFWKSSPDLLSERVAFARVANSGIHLAVQMRQAARAINPNFDSDRRDPQVFVLTDSFPIAQNVKEEGQPQNYQKAMTALRQLAVTAKLLHEAAGGE